MAKQNIYDNEVFFRDFAAKRTSEISFNNCIETPILLGMLPELRGKTVLDIGCGMGQHTRQFAEMGAASVLGIDISERMLAYAREYNSGERITYRRLAMEDLDLLTQRFDLITSSLVFDYAEDFEGIMRSIYRRMKEDARLVFSMSHPMATCWDGTFDRYTRTETGERLYANIRNYGAEGRRSVRWVVEDYVVYHRTFSTLLNSLLRAGFIIEECQEAHLSEDMRKKHPDMFGGVVHCPEFVFFRCRKAEGAQQSGKEIQWN